MLKIKKPLELEYRKMDFLINDLTQFYTTLIIIGAIIMILAYLWG